MSDQTKTIEMRDPDLDVIMAHGGPGVSGGWVGGWGGGGSWMNAREVIFGG